MPRVSIIIPALCESAGFEATLVSVLENRPADCEVLAVFNTKYEDPYELSGEVRFLKAAKGASWVDCVNLGIRRRNSPVVHLLETGCLARPNWTTAALAHFSQPCVGSVGCVIRDVQAPERIVATGVTCTASGATSLVKDIPGPKSAPTDAAYLGPTTLAAFYRGDMLDLLGGFSPAVAWPWAEADLAVRMKYVGYHSMVETRAVVWAESNLVRDGGAFARGQSLERLFWRSLPLFGWGPSLVRHPLAVMQSTLGSLWPKAAGLAEMAGRAKALAEFSQYGAAHEQLDQQRQQTLIQMAEAPAARSGRGLPAPLGAVRSMQMRNKEAA